MSAARSIGTIASAACVITDGITTGGGGIIAIGGITITAIGGDGTILAPITRSRMRKTMMPGSDPGIIAVGFDQAG